MRNVTITVDEETARWARLEAARQDTSVSRLVGKLLRERMLDDRGYDEAMNRYLGRTGAAMKSRRTRYPSRASLHERG